MSGPLRSMRGATAIVTGGGSGIGRALGAALARHGAQVVLADLDAPTVHATAAGLTAEGLDVAARVLDVTDREAFAGVVGELTGRGRLDVLVNCAGLSLGGQTHELHGAHWDRVLDVNLGGVINGVLAAYPGMVAAGRGRIVNVASGAGLVAPPFVVPYATSKHAVVGLSLGLRPEAALHGVQVCVVCPGAVETPILDRLPPGDLPVMASAPVTARAYLSTIGQAPVAADRFATLALRQIMRNQPIVIVPARAKSLWLLHRAAPNLTQRALRQLAARVQRKLLDSAPRLETGSVGDT